MVKSFRILAARHDEVNEGWIWFESALPTRTVVKLKNLDTASEVYCVSRKLDDNYVKLYNAGGKKYSLDPSNLGDVVLMSEWYRDALGIAGTTRDRPDARVRLGISPSTEPRWWEKPQQWWWGVRATSQHPDIVARVGTRLGVIGMWLGLVSLVPVVLTAFGFPEHGCVQVYGVFGVLLAAAVAAFLACQGVKHPRPGHVSSRGSK
jgi:hypothetical protein